MNDMDYYQYDYDVPVFEDVDEAILERVEGAFYDAWLNCIYPSLLQITEYIFTFLWINLSYRFLCRTVPTFICLRHIISIATGIIALYCAVGYASIYFIIFTLFNYLLLIFLSVIKVHKLGFIQGIVCITVLVVVELIEANPKLWHRIRGIQMIGAMKVISLAFDIEAKQFDRVPNVFAFMGYLFCPANCVLGPWVPYHEYMTEYHRRKTVFKSLQLMVINAIISIIFVLLSNCVVTMLVPEDSWKWIIAFRDALAFRCSHYFVSFLSQATMAASGYINVNGETSSGFGYQVTNPLSIEVPRSLVQVVVNWNIPMHKWLKTYIFRTIKPRSTFLAIFLTYLVSSLLHGMNLQIAAVLLSLSIYTYVEYSLRNKLSTIFNACCSTSTCKRNCNHVYKSNNTIVLTTNIFFSILTILHLAYLGVMFEASSTVQEEGFSLQHVLSKWQHLDYVSHLIIVFCYVFYIII